MSIAVDVPTPTHERDTDVPDFAADFDDAFDFDTDASAPGSRRACPRCGVVLAVAADGVAIPEHAVCPSPRDPFGIRACPGSGAPLAAVVPLADRVDAPPPATVMVLPAGLDWRAQPFSHGL